MSSDEMSNSTIEDAIKAFETQFDPSLSPFMDDVAHERMSYLRDRIADLTDVQDYRKTFMQFADEQLERIEALLKPMLEAIAQLREERTPFMEEKTAIRHDLKGDERKLESLQREWARLIAELEARKREADQRAALDAATRDAPWRKRALPHQLEGAYRLSNIEKGILGDKPGLGKTLQAIMTIDMLRAMDKTHRALIVCPKPVLDGFQREFSRFSPGQFVHVLNQSMRGLKSEVLDVIALMPDATVITNYEVWRKDKAIIEKLINCKFDTIILDEAHLLKNKESLTFRKVKEIVHAENQCWNCHGRTFGSGCPKCGLYPRKEYDNCSVKNVFPMTGTSILNKPQDLWSLLHLVDRNGFPDERSFLYDFCIQIQTDMGPRWTFGVGGEERLLNKLGMRFTARTRDSAGVKMPPQEIKHHTFDLDPEKYPKQAEFIRELRDKARIKFGDGVSVNQTETLAWYTRMRQSIEWPDSIRIPVLQADGSVTFWSPPTIGESIIMDEGQEIINEAVESGNRIVVFSKFKQSLIEMERRLKKAGISVVRYDGDLSDKDRLVAQRDFDLTLTRPEDSVFKVMLAQYDSAKVGLNLHGAQEVLFLGREWSPGMEQQAMERVRRIGSEFETIVHVLHVPGTATDLIDALLAHKEAMLEGFDSEVNLQEAMRKFLEG